MVWTKPTEFSANQPLTASQLNTYIRDNFSETAPAGATIISSIVGVDGMNKLRHNKLVRDTLNTQFSTQSSTPVSHGTRPIKVTFPHSGRYLAMFNVQSEIAWNLEDGAYAAACGVEGTGAPLQSFGSSIFLGDWVGHRQFRSDDSEFMSYLGWRYVELDEPGIATVEMKYWMEDFDLPVDPKPTALFERSRLTVLPF